MIRKYNNLSIGQKFLLLYVFGVFAPMVVLMAVLVGNVAKEVRQRESRNAMISFYRAATSIETQMLDSIMLSNAISTDSLIASQAYRYCSTPGEYYDSYIRLLLPQVRRYQNAYSRQVNNIELYVDNPTALSGGVCMRIEQFKTIPWIPEGYNGETVFIPYIKQQPGSADRLQISLVRSMGSSQSAAGMLTIDLSMEPMHRTMEQESAYLDLYLIAPDGYQISGSTATKTPAEQVRSSGVPENAELCYELGGSTAFSGWNLYGVINQLPIERSLRSSLMLCGSIGVICLALGGLLSWVFGHSMSRRSRELLRHMDNTMPGHFEPIPEPVGSDEIGELAMHFNTMSARLEDLIEDVYVLELQQKSLELERVCAELKYLQAQIDPHFLFNTLNGMLVMCIRNGYTELADVVRALAKIMRRMTDNSRDTVLLSEEIEFVRMVLQIEHFRFGDRLEYELCIDEAALNCTVPIMAVQGLVENACKHGIQPMSGVGRVIISAQKEASGLVLTVKDNGVSLSPEKLSQLRASLVSKQETGKHIGLQNIYRRLQLLYGQKASLTLDSTPGQGTTVTIRIPLQEENHVQGTAGR